MTILEILNLKFKDTGIEDAEKLLAIEEVTQAVKNYCNIEKVPEQLNFVIANMSIDLLRYQSSVASADTLDINNIGTTDISSLKIGDTTIQLGEGSPTNDTVIAKKSHVPNLDEIVMNNKEQLQKFRRMVW